MTSVILEGVVIGEVGDGSVNFYAFFGAGHDTLSIYFGQ